jgi:hypothetical protein
MVVFPSVANELGCIFSIDYHRWFHPEMVCRGKEQPAWELSDKESYERVTGQSLLLAIGRVVLLVGIPAFSWASDVAFLLSVATSCVVTVLQEDKMNWFFTMVRGAPSWVLTAGPTCVAAAGPQRPRRAGWVPRGILHSQEDDLGV